MIKTDLIASLNEAQRVEREGTEQDRSQAIKQWFGRLSLPAPTLCGCIGKSPGQPLCPCAMKYTETVNGRFWRINATDPENVTASLIIF